MKAAFVKIPAQVEIREIESPSPAEDEVLICIGACGICGSDLQSATQTFTDYSRFGHEFAGEITAVGDRVKHFKPGDKVIANPVIPCGECVPCLNGDPLSCKRMHAFRGGGCAEFYCDKDEFFLKYDGLSYIEGALAEPLTVAIDLVEEANIPLGGEVAVLGIGPIGLMAAKLCKSRGASKLILVDSSESKAKIQLGVEWGADVIIQVDKENLVETVLATSPNGVDRVLITAPPSVLNEAISICAFGGTIALIGTDSSGKQFVTLDVNRFHFKNITIKGAYNCPVMRFPLAFDLLRSKVINADKLISHTFPLIETQYAFDTALKKRDEIIKAMITMV